jgi:hypothetical protein
MTQQPPGVLLRDGVTARNLNTYNNGDGNHDSYAFNPIDLGLPRLMGMAKVLEQAEGERNDGRNRQQYLNRD